VHVSSLLCVRTSPGFVGGLDRPFAKLDLADATACLLEQRRGGEILTDGIKVLDESMAFPVRLTGEEENFTLLGLRRGSERQQQERDDERKESFHDWCEIPEVLSAEIS